MITSNKSHTAENINSIGKPVEFDTGFGKIVSFRWRGRYLKGAMRTYRNQKRIDAELRREEHAARIDAGREKRASDSNPLTDTESRPKARQGGKGAKARRRQRRSADRPGPGIVNYTYPTGGVWID